MTGGDWRILVEDQMSDVADFLARAFGTAGRPPEDVPRDEPWLFWSARLPAPGDFSYCDYTIRARHFRCVESFFVLHDATGRIRAVFSTNGLDTAKTTQEINLLACRKPAADDLAHVAALLGRVPAAIQEYLPVLKIRLGLMRDTHTGEAVGSFASPLLDAVLERCGYETEARLASEGGPGRDMVIRTLFLGGAAPDPRASEAAAAPQPEERP